MARPRGGEGGRPHGITSAIRQAKEEVVMVRDGPRWRREWAVSFDLPHRGGRWNFHPHSYAVARDLRARVVVDRALELLGATPMELAESRSDNGGSIDQRVAKHYALMKERRSQSQDHSTHTPQQG